MKTENSKNPKICLNFIKLYYKKIKNIEKIQNKKAP